MTLPVALPALLFSLWTTAPAAPANPNLPLDRPYTLRNAVPGLLEADHARQALGSEPLRFIHPRPCASELDTAAACGEPFRLAWRDAARDQEIGIAVMGAGEYRYLDENVYAGEGGILAGGHKGNASFWLDARAFGENSEGRRFTGSYDREAVDSQDGDITGSASFLSYARYRGGLSLDLPIGRLTVARDAAHWGPSLLGALVFNQDAVPFHQYTFTTHLGPVTVHSLYGDLLAAPVFTASPSKHLYGHRYEWRPHRDWSLGISEQLILTGRGRPYLFAPVFPLFISKSFSHEDANNGNIAFDAAWRLRGVGLLYLEALLDDMESPSSLLLKDYNQNKWAALAGVHLARDLFGGRGGAVFEACRIEPWVYTHFKDQPSQASNLDAPLGNPLGPNTLDLRLRLFHRSARGLYLGLTAAATWKGTGRGSTVNDTTYTGADALEPKAFLEGADGPDLTAAPQAAWTWSFLTTEAAWTFAAAQRGYLRLMARW